MLTLGFSFLSCCRNVLLFFFLRSWNYFFVYQRKKNTIFSNCRLSFQRTEFWIDGIGQFMFGWYEWQYTYSRPQNRKYRSVFCMCAKEILFLNNIFLFERKKKNKQTALNPLFIWVETKKCCQKECEKNKKITLMLFRRLKFITICNKLFFFFFV